MKKNKIKITPYLFIAPWFFGMILFTLGPLIMSLIMSLYDWPVIGERVFVGFKNYIDLFTKDPQFYKSLYITFKFTAFFVPLNIILSLILALLISKNIKGMSFFRIIFYLPTVVSSVAVSIIWGWILNTEFGILNYGLSLFKITGPDWLNNEIWALVALVLVSGWTVGTMMLVFYTALKAIPIELYESATIDGSGPIRTFFSITLPLITPTLLFNIVTAIIGALQNLALVLLLTNGGPLNSTYMYGLFVYNNAFKKSKLGYASASAWIMFILIIILTSLIFKTSKKWVFSIDDNKD
ncbi:sugar ABC transporter permease [Streptobacillus felis]|uniref:Sugar ABC transporter permease n=1 Tax=Streptobacillus felis TaxID=1384509 RepID=A0A7Z0PEP4_9FUSO|nr:sugar ABC transporter permease [Streptobacillus felis]NYV27851.1 sugar ABC transporter permease [Streptobacillus felis]